MPKNLSDNIIGQKIQDIRPMTKKELDREGWAGREQTVCIELSNGTILYGSRDYEGNGPGAIFGHTKAGDGFAF